jgi:hypothetical protein
VVHIKIKGKINACRTLVTSEKERDYLEDFDLDGRIKLKSILRQ